jgi:acyl-CoA thioester hydrolase
MQWFEYEVRVQPHHTDYAGIVWHGTYIQWMESARVECLREAGVAFADLVQLGYDLPVVDLNVRYHHPLRLGTKATVKTRMSALQGVRLNWVYEIVALEPETQLCLTGTVTLVPIDRAKHKIVRRILPELQQVFDKVEAYFTPNPKPTP